LRLLLITAIFITTLQQARAEPEVHLIPEGYVGWVAIAFEAANGEMPAYEGDARLYRIPRTGLLLTRASVNRGMGPAHSFFLESASGTRQRLSYIGPVADTPENRANSQIGLFEIGRGSGASKAGCRFEYDMYFVGTRTQYLDGGGRRFDHVRSLATAYVCS